MLQKATSSKFKHSRFDLAPTGALCYIPAQTPVLLHVVLISLPQERCATERDEPDVDGIPF